MYENSLSIPTPAREAALGVFMALKQEGAPLSRRQLRLRTGLALDDIAETLSALRRSGHIIALNTVIETFVVTEGTSAPQPFTSLLPTANESSIVALHTVA